MKSSHEKEKLLLKQKEKCGGNKQLNNNELDIYIYSSCCKSKCIAAGSGQLEPPRLGSKWGKWVERLSDF